MTNPDEQIMRDRHLQGDTAHLGAPPHPHLLDAVPATRLGIDAFDRGSPQFVRLFRLRCAHALTPVGHGGRVAGAWGVSVARLVFGFGHGGQDPHLRCSGFDDAQGDKAAIHQPVVRQLPTPLKILPDHRQRLSLITARVDDVDPVMTRYRLSTTNSQL